MNRFVRVVAIASIAVLAAVPSIGKQLSRILAESGLSPLDMEMMIRAEAVLYSVSQPKTGTVEAWSNPETEAHGTVTIINRNANCIMLQHEAHMKGREKALQPKRKFCKDDKGAWRLSL
ncbi:MAG: hypothetical protein P1U91_19550 [Pseudophaeobacter sp. bin_em_oilr2.035]|uniref:Surface antigen domain-containing protein n=1 Tax=Phaeobacter gallaeciensis TaxID=60890 RepID=A0ABD4XFH4_9RHOB|nr:hypothetical protein [Phaeobacter gallaeciensis]MDF1774155.1 hypothetical protein [Pseudophaeobacter sp. bin_em_oilr2.035]MDE4147008.1 hypothetical protein [Phaeobacter gallaeciensis]MDE4159636.1 hypothetical protein [Phaeobacter gallaeciensis]MDE4163857.1 hypothetical protein [Phaeobacter gallaeciensis]MDE4168090.1 hypothetical protein [Phaeobacter gallaeciensis]